MPAALAGYTVGITGDRRWQEQAEMLSGRGAQVQHGPVMRTGGLDDADATLAATLEALAAPLDVVVLTTGIGTRSWLGLAESSGLDEALRAAAARARVVARGPKARAAAESAGVRVDWQAQGETGAELLAHLRAGGLAGRRVVVQRDGGEPRLAEALRADSAEVVDVPVYRWEPAADPGPARRLIEATVAGRIHAVTFTCGYAVATTFALAPDPDALRAALAGPAVAVAVGPVTAGVLRAHGVGRVVEPRRARLGAMVQALVAASAGWGRVLELDGAQVRWQGDLLVGADGSEALLTPGESRLLGELVRRAPGVVPKADLVEPGADPHAAEVAVGRLRAKLGPLAPGIRAVPRRGYLCTLRARPG